MANRKVFNSEILFGRNGIPAAFSTAWTLRKWEMNNDTQRGKTGTILTRITSFSDAF